MKYRSEKKLEQTQSHEVAAWYHNYRAIESEHQATIVIPERRSSYDPIGEVVEIKIEKNYRPTGEVKILRDWWGYWLYDQPHLRIEALCECTEANTVALFGGVAYGTAPQGKDHRDVGSRSMRAFLFPINAPVTDPAFEIESIEELDQIQRLGLSLLRHQWECYMRLPLKRENRTPDDLFINRYVGCYSAHEDDERRKRLDGVDLPDDLNSYDLAGDIERTLERGAKVLNEAGALNEWAYRERKRLMEIQAKAVQS